LRAVGCIERVVLDVRAAVTGDSGLQPGGERRGRLLDEHALLAADLVHDPVERHQVGLLIVARLAPFGQRIAGEPHRGFLLAVRDVEPHQLRRAALAFERDGAQLGHVALVDRRVLPGQLRAPPAGLALDQQDLGRHVDGVEVRAGHSP
jgi:hypothetical protein